MPECRDGMYHCSHCECVSFLFEEDALEHERYYCPESPTVDEEWNDSPLNPQARRCATCAKSASFLMESGNYREDQASHDCPQRLLLESERKFPCAAYVRCLTFPLPPSFNTRHFSEVSLRYLRSFKL